MAKNPKYVPITDLKQDADAVLNRVRKSPKPLVITQRGRAAAIMLSAKAYAQSERERSLLRLLVRGEKEIGRGKGYDLDEVLKEADEFLGRKS